MKKFFKKEYMLKTPYKSDRMLLEKMLYSNINGNIDRIVKRI